MINDKILERNMLALSSRDPELSIALGRSSIEDTHFCKASKRGMLIPWTKNNGHVGPVHSTIDPEKEGIRFYQHHKKRGFLIFAGFGGGYHVKPFLGDDLISGMLIIEASLSYVKMVFSHFDLTQIILDSRVSWLVEADEETIHTTLLEKYIPAVSGNLHYLPLSSRAGRGDPYFEKVRNEIQRSIENFSADYSVQSYFGKQWFKNTIKNLPNAQSAISTISSIRKAYITAAGPGLEQHLDTIEKRSRAITLIATDTSLPLLISKGIRPDMVISIDCQQITYHHFLKGYPKDVPLVMDLASPHFLATLSDKPFYFTSGHPFSRYINSNWRRFPFIDTSGGNVGHAAVSLADHLGAREIHLFGADFSYPRGKTYSRGTYLYPYFSSGSNRLSPQEHLFMSFLFSNDTLTRRDENDDFAYTTRPMLNYHQRLRRLSSNIEANLFHYSYNGEVLAPKDRKPFSFPDNGSRTLFAAGSSTSGWEALLESYDSALASLPRADYSFPIFRSRLTPEQAAVCLTLFPAAAAIRKESGNDSQVFPGAAIINAASEWTRTFIKAFRETYASYISEA
jgi:hypothetical protein